MPDDTSIDDAVPGDVLAELARIVLAEETLDSVLSKVFDLTKQVIVGADEVSMTLVRRGRAETAAYTGEMAMQADERQYGLGTGPCLDAARGGEILYVSDMQTEARWPDYAPQAAGVGIRCSVSIPLPIQEDLIGALNIYSRSADAFDPRDTRAGEAFAAYAAIAVANADTFTSTAEAAEHLRRAMASRATIEQAKGVLIAQSGCDPDEAFTLLVRASQRENKKLRDVAADIVARAQHRPSPERS